MFFKKPLKLLEICYILLVIKNEEKGGILYISSYIRLKGKYYHLVVEICKYGKRTVKSKSSKTSDKTLAEQMLPLFEQECVSVFNLNVKNISTKKVKKASKDQIFNEISEKINIFDGEVKFCEFIKYYVYMRYKTISDETYSSYLSITKNAIIPYFFKDNKNITDIDALDIQRFYYHELNIREVSANTVIHFHNFLSLVFKYAMKIGIISKNPIFLVEKPRKERFVGKTYNPEEVKRLLKLLKDEYPDVFTAIYIALQYGLRRSEVVGLKWSSIDFEENTLKIISTVTQTTIEGKQIITCKNKTKSITGIRSFPLTSKIKEILLDLKKEQINNRRKYGASYSKKEEDFVFVNPVGERINPKYLSDRFAYILKKHKLPYIRFHDLRHTAATLLYGANLNVKDIQVFLGHSSARTTMDIYVHLLNKSNVSTVSAIEERISI